MGRLSAGKRRKRLVTSVIGGEAVRFLADGDGAFLATQYRNQAGAGRVAALSPAVQHACQPPASPAKMIFNT